MTFGVRSFAYALRQAPFGKLRVFDRTMLPLGNLGVCDRMTREEDFPAVEMAGFKWPLTMMGLTNQIN